MNLKALALQVLEGKEEIKPTVKKSEFTPKLLTRKSLVKFTPQTWLTDNEEELREAGFTDRDIYGLGWYRGLADLNLWNKEDLRVELRGDQLCFTWHNGHNAITQTSRPENRQQ